jgi:wyosine [tRNA(Phe)-imidazoG37] synthetase (radical SAM superfamily)
MDISEYQADLPDIDAVAARLEKALATDLQLDLITFSGNGEPTIHPHFADLVDEVVALRDKYRPHTRVALLSNSTGLVNERVRTAMSKIDLPVLKLDVGNDRKFRAINRPAKGIRFDDIVKLLSSVDNAVLQTVLADGAPSNTEKDDLEDYFEKLATIQPREVHLYSIDRPVPNQRISLVPPGRLEDIATRAHKATGVKVKAFYSSS